MEKAKCADIKRLDVASLNFKNFVFASFSFCRHHVKSSKNFDDLVLWARSLSNHKYSVSVWN